MPVKSTPQTMPSKKPRLTAVLPSDLYKTIEKIAECEERSMSQMAAILIREALSARSLDRTSGKKS